MADGIETIFNEIYDRTHQKILIYITGKCHKVEDISDIFQDTYMEMIGIQTVLISILIRKF